MINYLPSIGHNIDTVNVESPVFWGTFWTQLYLIEILNPKC